VRKRAGANPILSMPAIKRVKPLKNGNGKMNPMLFHEGK